MTKNRITDEEALAFHFEPSPGKFEISATVPMTTQRDLSLAYSPGVAVPCEAIAAQPETAYDYTNKGNLVAVISNGTAVLGLGNLGALASKPVMEGKAVLFKRFADVNSIDIELDTEDTDAFINAVKLMGPTFGGINLEDIKAPECFIIEQRLKEEMDIPVFHDDQHGTAVICAAGLMNALHHERQADRGRAHRAQRGRGGGDRLPRTAQGDGGAARQLHHVRHQGRDLSGSHRGDEPVEIGPCRQRPICAPSLDEAMKTARTCSWACQAKGAVTQAMVESMAENPVIFAMANPDPEITPEDAHEVRADAIVATGRSDYPNQVNNVLGFPYLFRGALDIHARAINDEMKIACAHALAGLAREDVPDEVAMAYGRTLTFGRDYIIPTPFDPRLIHRIPPAVARAGMDTGAARRPIIDMEAYEVGLEVADGSHGQHPARHQCAGAGQPKPDDLCRRGRSQGAAGRRSVPAVRSGPRAGGRADRRYTDQAGSRRDGGCRARAGGGQRRQHAASGDLQGLSLQPVAAQGVRPQGHSSACRAGPACLCRAHVAARPWRRAGYRGHAQVGACAGADQPRLRRRRAARGRRVHGAGAPGADRVHRRYPGA